MVNVFIVRLDHRGRIILPCDIRQHLGINIGDFVMLSVNKDKIEMIPSEQKGRLISRNVFEL